MDAGSYEKTVGADIEYVGERSLGIHRERGHHPPLGPVVHVSVCVGLVVVVGSESLQTDCSKNLGVHSTAVVVSREFLGVVSEVGLARKNQEALDVIFRSLFFFPSLEYL
jgi:hypothetical protein